MARFIDLDPVRTPVGEFQLNGKKYTVWPLKIEQIINMSLAEEADTATMPQAEQFRRMVTGLRAAIPDCPEDELLQLDMQQFNALTAWLRDPDGTLEKNTEPPPQATPEAETAA